MLPLKGRERPIGLFFAPMTLFAGKYDLGDFIHALFEFGEITQGAFSPVVEAR